jgi:hypothetical protein
LPVAALKKLVVLAGSYENELPQLHVRSAFGFSKVKPRPMMLD